MMVMVMVDSLVEIEMCRVGSFAAETLDVGRGLYSCGSVRACGVV